MTVRPDSNGWRLLLTRPAEECAVLAGHLAEEGIHGSSLPLLAIEPLAETPELRSLFLDLDRYSAVIVVSKPAARLGLELLDRYWPQPPANQCWFGVGAATGEILADYGLTAVWPTAGEDSEALLALPELAAALAVPRPRVLILRGEGGRELIADSLHRRGLPVDHVELYRRTLPDYPPGTLLERIRTGRLNGLQISSGQGFEHLRQLAAADWPALLRIPLFVPSPRVAEMARAAGFQTVVDCHGASATALLAALQGRPAPTF
ncbi:uroporphyrinogen-III synthase [Azotobacter chroococcum]|uniref:Uroporphyrinogen-III synthase n=1 Tax=Azotobacter chroococcum TaxID=353 RepID=A0AA43Z934_9GAMM|nr:uroporphyrinogen-III synthase [Azotobacter chroococcum]NHN78642.1 uroporphyrinogen-III synthase [Azotobacter chroococcum]